MRRQTTYARTAATRRRIPQNAWLRAVAVLLIGQMATACVVPRSMHVANGTTPEKSDINVRFRTTYYFRVFDYCWSAGANIESGKSYKEIVPETDTLYRYRMTGKASALGNQIKFESGTLQKEQIDPFGADVVYDKGIDGYVYRSASDAKQQAEAIARQAAEAAERGRALDDFKVLADMFEAAAGDAGKQALLKEAMQTALSQYLGTFRRPLDDATLKLLNDLKAQVEALKTPAPAETDPVKQLRSDVAEEIKTLKADVETLKTRPVATLSQFCAMDQIQRRGFQIMGPEGMRPFDQDARLILAMHSSAKPLIETLSEYSGRLLQPQVNPAEQLLPLARETTTIVRTQRALDQVALKAAEATDTKTTLADVFDAARQTFTPGTK